METIGKAIAGDGGELPGGDIAKDQAGVAHFIERLDGAIRENASAERLEIGG